MDDDDVTAEIARQTVRAWPDLALGTKTARPKAWGALAAQGVIALREHLGRAPSDAERRALWSALWSAARKEPGSDR
ncbi:MAG: hypothetical protein E6H87_06140 [Chloroflexi bacterium]|nr:MAG: hypothetical protein E6H87_06140 [Chloroflexota bacterium]